MKENDILKPKFVGVLKPELVIRIENEDGSITIIDNNPEVWTTIDVPCHDYSRYEVSSKGRVRQKSTGKILSKNLRKDKDVFRVSLVYIDDNGKNHRTDEYVSYVVHETFFSRPEGMENTRMFVITRDDYNGQNDNWANLSLIPQKRRFKRDLKLGKMTGITDRQRKYAHPIDAYKFSKEIEQMHIDGFQTTVPIHVGMEFHFDSIRAAARAFNIHNEEIIAAIVEHRSTRGFYFYCDDDLTQFNDWYDTFLRTPGEERVENLPGEIWKPLILEKYDLSLYYHVSNKGRIKTLHTNNQSFTSLVTQKVSYNYRHSVGLSFNGIRKEFSVSFLVATLFVDNPNNYKVVHHISDNPEDNRSSNLLWVNPKKNAEFTVLHGHAGKNYIYLAPIIVEMDGKTEYYDSFSMFCRDYRINAERAMKSIAYKKLLWNAKTWYKLSYRYARKRLFHIDGLSERYFIDTNGVESLKMINVVNYLFIKLMVKQLFIFL